MILNLFSSKQKNEHLNGGQDKFEMVSCPRSGKFCEEVRSKMNMNYANSLNYLQYNEYDKSINALENAYYKTFELNAAPCSRCAAFFRSTITDSIETIYKDLDSMSHGLFKTNRYQSSCEKAKVVLDKLKKGVVDLKEAI